MKSGLTVVLFWLFTIGVFVGGKESNGELVPVMEGDSVTLMSGVTEIQINDEIEWEFNGSSLATISIDSVKWFKPDGPFRNRLQLDNKTGDLKISNIKTTDFGLYKPTISSPDGSPPEMTFTVKVVSADEVTSVSVNEGDSVTLKPDPTYIQGSDVIRWRFGQQKSLVAEINRTAGIFNTFDGPDERFRDRLTLNNQTGSLNITNIRTTDSGLYEAEISSTRSSYTMHYTQSFNVTVSDVKSVLLMERDSVTLRTGLTKIQRNDKILWKFGDHGEFIADLNNVNKTRRNIDLNSTTGDLTIRYIRRDQRGDYKVEIITRRMILHSKYSITVGNMTSVSVKEGKSVTLQIVTEIQSDDLIVWMFGGAIIAEIYEASQLFLKHDGPDERFRDRLQLDNQTGSLTITNTRTTDSGNYKAEITGRRYTINKIITVTVSGSGVQSGSGLSSGAVAGIALLAVAVGVAVGAAGVVMYYRRKNSERERQREENGGNPNKQNTDEPATEETKMTNDP